MIRLTLHARACCPCIGCILDRQSQPAALMTAGEHVVLDAGYAQALGQLAIAVRDWRSSRCSSPADWRQGEPRRRDGAEACDGDNHLENCAVEIARQDLLAAHNKLGH